MKIIFTSDIHDSAYYRRRILNIYSESGTGRLAILGDSLYHSPCNNLLREYVPKEVTAMLNPPKNQIYAIRGNCDAEVDQMVLELPILADYGLLVSEGKVFYATHGRVYNQDRLLSLQDGDILTHDHTHILKAETIEAGGGRYITVLNPGPVSIPKGGNPNTHAVLGNGVFSIWTLEGEVVKELRLQQREAD